MLVHVLKKDTSEQVVPPVAVQEGDAWHVVGTAAGSPKHPAWVYGLRRMTTTEIEVPGQPPATVRVSVSEVGDAERARIWEKFVDFSPSFADYLKTAKGRVFPIFKFDRALTKGRGDTRSSAIRPRPDEDHDFPTANTLTDGHDDSMTASTIRAF